MKKILLIEDDPDIGDIVLMALQNKYTVNIMTDSTDLLETLGFILPDVIMTDNFVGEERALDIIKKIRSLDHFKTTPVILFSAYPEIEKLGTSIGATAYLSKPFELAELHRCIEEALNKMPAIPIVL